MSAKYVLLFIIAILVLLSFIIYLYLEKSIIKAILFVLLLVITVILGVLVEDVHSWNDNNLPSADIRTESNNTVENNSTLETNNDNAISGNIVDLFPSPIIHIFNIMSPSTKPFARKIDKNCFSGATIIILILLSEGMSLSLIHDNRFKKIIWSLASIVFICFINWHIPYVFAYMLSSFYVVPSLGLKILLTCIQYFLTIMVCLAEKEMELWLFSN